MAHQTYWAVQSDFRKINEMNISSVLSDFIILAVLTNTSRLQTYIARQFTKKISLGRIAQSVTCLTADICLAVDPGVASSIRAWSHTEIYHEIISTAILLPSADSRRAVVSYKRKYL